MYKKHRCNRFSSFLFCSRIRKVEVIIMRRTNLNLNFAILFVVLIARISECVEACEDDDPCTTSSGTEGSVMAVIKCKSFKTLKTYKERLPCGFAGRHPLICCPEIGKSESRFVRKVVAVCDGFGKKPEKDDELGDRIINGEDSEVGEFPHFAALGYRNNEDDKVSFDCAGALIAKNLVLTAAHCCKESRKPSFVRLGKVN